MNCLDLKENTFGSFSEEGCYRLVEFGMGTVIEQKVWGRNPEDACLICREVSSKLKELESAMSFFLPGSYIGKLNAFAGEEQVKVNDELAEVLEKAAVYHKITRGAFDITVARITELWRRHQQLMTVPDKREIEKLLPLVDGSSVVLDRENLTAGLLKKGQALDLGGIGKGYAADEAKKIYMKMGARAAFVNLGGNVQVLGEKIGREPWNIGLQHPREERGVNIAVLNVRNRSVVTSGDYEKYFMADGTRYHHIVDPGSGYPAKSGLMSATVLTESSMDADALSTAAFVLGMERGMDLIEGFGNTEAVFITDRREVFVTEGLKDDFYPVKEAGDYKFYVYH